MSVDSPENEWELSKENVQPLRQGRKISSLNAGLKVNSGDQISRIKEEKHVFEAELRTYSGDDPIEVWYRYILWAEQSFPKGGRDSNLTTILERCVRQFKDVENYRNDERYIYAWMKMADVCNDPLEIYNFMYDQNIGCDLSCFYEGWACLLEQLGNYKKADSVYQNGLRRNAKPYENLKHRHEDFQKRVARKMVNGGEDSMDGSQESEGQHRQVLSQLRTMGKRKQAPVSRTGSAIRGSAGVLSGARPKIVPQVSSGEIQIFCDENQDPASLPPQTGQWTTVPKRDVTNKENEKKAGVWTKQKMGKPSVSVPISAVNSYKQPSFSVHVDENNDQNMRTPAKLPEIGNQVLSSRKEDKTTTSSYLRTMTSTQDKSERPMYCKDKIYCGAEEYSFEELRAIRWMKRKEREEEERAVEEVRAKLQQERQQLLDEAERVKQQRLQLQNEEKAMLEEARRKRQEIQQQMERNRQAEIQRHQEMLEKDIQSRLQEQNVRSQELASASKSQLSARQLLFEDGCHGNTENIPPQMMAQLQASSSKRPLQQQQQCLTAGNQSLNSSNRTPNSFASISQPQSAESFDRTMSGAPSPTVNTKEAMRLVMGMFNTSLELDKPAPSEDIQMIEPEQPVQPAGSGTAGSGLPFMIYDESQEQKKAPPKPFAAPFTVFQDENNSIPSNNTSTRNTSIKPTFHQQSRSTTSENIREPATRSLPMFEDDNFEGIESHPRDDITLAPVGSHLSFAAAAKFASTPFNPNSSGGARNSPSLDVSDIEMHEDNKHEPAAPAGPETNTEDMEHQESKDQTASNSSSNSFRKNLSPIMEGSSEDSSANSKSSKLHHTTMESHHVLSKVKLTPVMDQSEDTMSLLQAVDDGNQSMHVIDTSAYIPPDLDEKTEQLMSMSICIVDPKDPFDREDREKMLSHLKTPLHHFDTYNKLDEHMPSVRKGNILSLGLEVYEVMEKIAEGGFAKIYLVEDNELDLGTRMMDGESSVKSTLAIKVEEPAQKWEFYICNELHNRLSKLNDPVDVRPSVMQIINGFFFENGSILVTEYQPRGTLLDLVNKCKKKNLQSEAIIQHLEPVMAFMTIELLHLIENIHKCHIIHGDIKPDNFLVLQFPRLPVSTDPLVVFGGTSRFVQLIDFGQSIDMSKYPAGTTFLTKVNTQCFQCIEMKTNRPWTYQTDLFGLAGTIHVMIFNQYMKVYQEGGIWKMTSKFTRNWNSALWKKLFHQLLNVPSCDELPDIAAIRQEFENYFVNDLLQKYNTQCGSFNKTIASQ
ncbi:mitotic checkpoint serine/threonine-protein kinase BUB1-like isoform X2 [Mercenaria mercenaria]|uniref:mitotic checkpoint serine/threonine-protein kinase BUB1-like isoform X2 n=1 Tax=Mercenaria mercenaria TaxID=6596 RepID=UPI00234E39BC|nr:mitotic checkpoint serine/threonine-protein kinase BUB1-like isoform X2 [Mercenaria mercenaria]